MVNLENLQRRMRERNKDRQYTVQCDYCGYKRKEKSPNVRCVACGYWAGEKRKKSIYATRYIGGKVEKEERKMQDPVVGIPTLEERMGI